MSFVSTYPTNTLKFGSVMRVEIEKFLEEARRQLDQLFGQDVRDIKTLLSEKLALESYETFNFKLKPSTPVGETRLLVSYPGRTPQVRGWFLLGESPTGNILLKFIPSQILIAEIDLQLTKTMRNKNIFIRGNLGDTLHLYWSNLYPYSSIFAQLDVVDMYKLVAIPWLDPWTYRKSHEIIGSTAGEVTDYQVRITVHYGGGADSGEHVYLNGKCRTDFGDIRFTDSDGVTELPYWMEEKVDGDYAVFWVKIPRIPANPGKTTIYVYYGNPSATYTGDGDQVFEFFDDFEDGVIDTNKWDVNNASEANGLLTLSATSTLDAYAWGRTTFFSASINKRVKARSKRALVDKFSILCGLTDSEAGGGRYDAVMWTYAAAVDVFRARSKNDNTAEDTDLTFNDDIFHIWEILWYDDGGVPTAKFFMDGALQATHSTYVPTAADTDLTVEFYAGALAGNTIDVDWVFVAKYIYPEPSHGVWGSEETK